MLLGSICIELPMGKWMGVALLAPNGLAYRQEWFQRPYLCAVKEGLVRNVRACRRHVGSAAVMAKLAYAAARGNWRV